MRSEASDVARRLAEQAEGVCRHYLSNGRREGRYWLVGDVMNTPGRSLYVRLGGHGGTRVAVGKWTDAATGEHGDLIDLIAAAGNLPDLRAALDEARSFLSVPRQDGPDPRPPALPGSAEAARRLIAISRPIPGTLGETYLRNRGVVDLRRCGSLRFHPRCFYRPGDLEPVGTRRAWPALVAAVTDAEGTVTGVHRTWLDPTGTGKAAVATPRRALGDLVGNAVRFGRASDVMAAGEGIETILSLRSAVPELPMAAGLSAAHLAAFVPPTTLRRLYIAADKDSAGHWAAESLTQQAQAQGIEPLTLNSTLADFNDDLRRLGSQALAAAIRVQLAPEDVARFWRSGSGA